MTAVVLFNVYRGTYRYAISHAVAMIVGTILLWVLCAANMEFAAYGLILLPLLFFVFLVALIFYDQSLFAIQTSYNSKRGTEPSCETPSETEPDSEADGCGSA